LCLRARVVPENILKKQARDAKILTALKDSRVKAKEDRKVARKVAHDNAQKYFNEYAAADKNLIENRRKAKKEGWLKKLSRGSFHPPDNLSVTY